MNFNDRNIYLFGASILDGLPPTAIPNEFVVEGRGWFIGDNAIFTAAHVIYEWNRNRTIPDVVTGDIGHPLHNILLDDLDYKLGYLQKINLEISTETAITVTVYLTPK